MHVYLDNAATTPLDPQVLEAMMPYMTQHYGNPSSVHAHGRATRSAIEQARKQVADILSVSPGEIFFTSGGTEADNTAIRCSIEAYQLQYAITSPLEHHAVLHTLQTLADQERIQLHYVAVDAQGHIDLAHLEELLRTHGRSLVSLMHGNNEIGNLTDVQQVGELCASYGAVFHSDTVQTLAHYPLDLYGMKAHCIAGAAHKFHGPKGVGLLYINKSHKINPLLHGGAQERNMRGGTENLYGIVGLAKALEISYANMDQDRQHILLLKRRTIDQLRERIPDVQFNGASPDPERSLYTVLNVSLPPSDNDDMLLFSLDLHRISVSGGSACSSGAATGSHVLRVLDEVAMQSRLANRRSANHRPASRRPAIRFSFSKYNTLAEINYAVDTLASLYPVAAPT